MDYKIIVAFLAFLSFCQLGAIAWIYHKLSNTVDRLLKQSNAQNNNLFIQIEALLSLYAEIRPVHGLPPTRGWAASPDFLRLLVCIVNEHAPMTVVECSSGLSTLVLSYCMKKLGRGKVLSLEHDPVYAEKTRFMLRQHQLENIAEVIEAPLHDLALPGWRGKWYDTERIPSDISINMLVVDGPPWFTTELARYPAFPILRNQLTGNSMIVLDDADREAEKAIVEKWLAEASQLVRIDAEKCEKGCVILGMRQA